MLYHSISKKQKKNQTEMLHLKGIVTKILILLEEFNNRFEKEPPMNVKINRN